MTKRDDAVLLELRRFGLTFPGATTRSPWPGHKDLVVKDKTFAFLSVEGEPLSLSVRLKGDRLTAARKMKFTEPTGYGLAKWGWISAAFPLGVAPPVDLLKQWIDESYRIQAPKKLVAELDREKPAAKTKKKKTP